MFLERVSSLFQVVAVALIVFLIFSKCSSLSNVCSITSHGLQVLAATPDSDSDGSQAPVMFLQAHMKLSSLCSCPKVSFAFIFQKRSQDFKVFSSSSQVFAAAPRPPFFSSCWCPSGVLAEAHRNRCRRFGSQSIPSPRDGNIATSATHPPPLPPRGRNVVISRATPSPGESSPEIFFMATGLCLF